MTWRGDTSEGRYAEAEAAMLAETDLGEGLFPDCELLASFYENWGDRLDCDERELIY